MRASSPVLRQPRRWWSAALCAALALGALAPGVASAQYRHGGGHWHAGWGGYGRVYSGLPLRPEFRVFYDFDKREVLFSVNYWDFDYVFPHLYDATDKIVFRHERPRLEYEFSANKKQVEDMILNHLADVAGLDGPWSVDLLQDEHGPFLWNGRIQGHVGRARLQDAQNGLVDL